MPTPDRYASLSRAARPASAALVLSLALTTFISIPPSPVFAQSKPTAAKKSAQPSSQAAIKSYEAGVKAFDKGKVSSAVTSLSAALRQGGLPPQKMAKALFYRGSAYRKQKKPAQAISDLTSAIWIKGGLSDGDRLAAMDQRNAAYKEAGLGTKVPQGLQPGAGVPSTAVATSVPVVATPAPAPAPSAVTSTSSGAATSAWTTTADAAAPAVKTQVAKAAPPTAAPTASPFSALTPTITPTPPPSTTVSALPRGDAPATQPTTGIGTAVSNIGTSISNGFSGVGSFFGNMFSSNSGSSAQTPAQGTQIATSSTARAPQLNANQQVSSPSGNSGPAVTQGWGSATKSSALKQPPSRPVQTAAIVRKAQPVAKPKTPSAGAGKFRLQVAAVRSEAKAQQVVAQLKTKYAKELAGAQPKIDAAAIGNMGTFYRVRVGPFADTNAPRGLCARLKPDGYDCLIVTP